MQKSVFAAIALTLGAPLAAMPVYQHAENQVPVTVTEVLAQADETIVVLKVDAPLHGVCWHASDSDSPYLISGGQRFTLLGGASVSWCPDRQDYAAGQTMQLRFRPLPPGTAEFSLVEGRGGEDQMAGQGDRTTRFWNFLHISLNR